MLCFILAFLAVPKVKFFFVAVNSFFGCCNEVPKICNETPVLLHEVPKICNEVSSQNQSTGSFLNRRKQKTTVLHSHAGHPTFSGVIKMITNVVYLFRKISMKNRVSYTDFKIRKDFTGFSALPRIILRCLMMHAAVK